MLDAVRNRIVHNVLAEPINVGPHVDHSVGGEIALERLVVVLTSLNLITAAEVFGLVGHDDLLRRALLRACDGLASLKACAKPKLL